MDTIIMIILLSMILLLSSLYLVLPIKKSIIAKKAGNLIYASNMNRNIFSKISSLFLPIVILFNTILRRSKYDFYMRNIDILIIISLLIIIIGTILDIYVKVGSSGEIRENGFFTFFGFVNWEKVKSFKKITSKNRNGNFKSTYFKIELKNGRTLRFFDYSRDNSEIENIFIKFIH